MQPVSFPECNCNYGPPSDMEESQVARIPAFQGTINTGSCDGAKVTVVAWKPSQEEIQDIIAGKPIFLSMFGGLAPHYLATSFKQSINVA